MANLGYLIFFHAKVDHMDGSFGSFPTIAVSSKNKILRRLWAGRLWRADKTFNSLLNRTLLKSPWDQDIPLKLGNLYAVIV